MEQITLYYQQGSSDKMYQASIEPSAGGYTVPFAFGRRGTTLQAGTKTHTPVSYAEAKKIFDRMIAEKQAKGYSLGEAGTPYQHTAKEALATGIHCQLLHPVAEEEVESLLRSPHWWLQEKFDGKRLLLLKSGAEIIGINRRGLQVALPQPLVEEASQSPVDLLLDGEIIGDQFHVFDLLQIVGMDLRATPYLERFLRLMRLWSTSSTQHLRLVQNACTAEEKQRQFQELKARGAKGVVFKNITSSYRSGSPDRQSPALKFKFQETASFVVGRINEQRSVSLLLFSEDRVKPAGNVTIPANHEVPALGSVVEVRYLYAFRESGCIYQPVYLGPRDDIASEECSVTQLKYKVDLPAIESPALI